MRRGWKTLISTQELLEFARRHHVPLGRQNPTRTLNYYIRLGLLPPRHRTSDGRFHWGFPLHARHMLLRVRDLKRQQRTLAQIKDLLQREFRASHETQLAQRETGLAGLPFDDPVWDYSVVHYEIQAKDALDALEHGDLETARRILQDMVDLAEGARQGKRFLLIIGEGADAPPQGEKRSTAEPSRPGSAPDTGP